MIEVDYLIDKTISKKLFRKNEQIRVGQVFLIDAVGNKIGVLSTQDALTRARQEGLDLVEVAPLANPPVAKIVDFGKLQYEQEKADRKSRAKSKSGDIKGIRLTAKIGDHDLLVRVRAGQKFLDKGDKIKIELNLRGREQAHPELAKEVIDRFIGHIDREIVIEQPMRRLGRRISLILALKRH